MKKKVVTVATIVFVASVVFAGSAKHVITGMVEYSFDQNERLIRTADTVYALRVDSLGETASKALDAKLGSVTSVSVSPEDIAYEWPALNAVPASTEADRAPASLAASDSFLLSGDSLRVVGSVEPSTAAGTVLVKSAGIYFLIRKQDRVATGPGVDLVVKRSDVMMAWPAASR